VEEEIDLSVVNVIALSMENAHLLDDTHQWNRGKQMQRHSASWSCLSRLQSRQYVELYMHFKHHANVYVEEVCR
jgi:hypothetical protein